MFDLFFKTKGILSRKQFLLGVAGIAAIAIFGNLILRFILETTGHSMLYFISAPVFWILFFYTIYCVYGKRLTDMGRSKGLVFVMFALVILMMIVVMLMFGGAEYFSEFSQFDRKEAIDPEVTQAIIEKYKAEISANMTLITPLLMGIPVLFTLWLLLAKSEA